MDKKYAFTYSRISSYKQIGNNSFTAQEKANKNTAKEHNIKIIRNYQDTAKSGTSTEGRDGYSQMMKDLETNSKVKYILVHRLDRLHRNAYNQLGMIKELTKKGITILTADGIDTSDPEFESMILDEAINAQKYSIRLANETKKGLRVNAEKMLHNGGIPPYGYAVGADRRLCIDKTKEQAVKKIFEMYASGMSYQKIIKWLDDNGYTTVKGKSFCKTSIKSILENEKYCGTYFWDKRASKNCDGHRNNHKYKEEYYREENAIPAIVSRETFNQVQARLRDNKSKIKNYNGKNFYPMNGKIFCSECGKPLKGKVQYSRTNKNNLPVKQYKFSCDCQKIKTVNEKYLDDMIIHGLQKCIFSPVNRDELLQKLNEYGQVQNKEIDQQIEILKNERAGIDKKNKNLMEIVEDGNNIKTIIEQIKEYDEQIKRIDNRIKIYESSRSVFTEKELDLIEREFADYVREECNEDTITFLNDTIAKIKIGNEVNVELKKNITVDHDTKKNFNQ